MNLISFFKEENGINGAGLALGGGFTLISGLLSYANDWNGWKQRIEIKNDVLSETKLFTWSTKCKYYSVYEGSTNITAQLPPRDAKTLLEELNAIEVEVVDTKLKDYKKEGLGIDEKETITVEDIFNKYEKYEAEVIEEYFNLKTMALKKELTMEDLRDPSKILVYKLYLKIEYKRSLTRLIFMIR